VEELKLLIQIAGTKTTGGSCYMASCDYSAPKLISPPGQTCKTVSMQKGTYYWHVQALGEETTGPWSAPRKIVVK